MDNNPVKVLLLMSNVMQVP